ncbi:hypothetical protein GIY23_12960 [Allosaccharopolyspora coralli]|uniref:Replication-relaxation n=1 Tax=Allosaccharopolyspora coralli TaxID=2665642 RepID=A0A5Q3Q760_9PSEU|nr:replication-relaxation family protein [Allosaccharopolyspora coralli]QGK70312.1 hypothetical protein GIY23_12960 [Allosaccharopolyspora coralli]
MFDARSRQHDLRSPVPTRPTGRAAISNEHQATIAGRLTARDRWIARMVAEHGTLTSTQLARVAFPCRRTANKRLPLLYRWRVLNRFQPYVRSGAAPMFYVLDSAGAHLLAHEDGIDPHALKFRSERAIGIAHSLRLAHLHGVNDLFTGLIAHALHHDQRALAAWWSETRCARHFGDLVRPDGYGRWRIGDREIEFFLEFDTGSYQLSRLVAKLPGYAELATTSRIVTPILTCFARPEREAHARRLLADHLRTHSRPRTVPVATTTVDTIQQAGTSADQVWLPLHPSDSGRLHLIDLTTAWPHLPAPTAPTGTTNPTPEATRAVRLSPPASMPPFTRTTLDWNPSRTTSP